MVSRAESSLNTENGPGYFIDGRWADVLNVKCDGSRGALQVLGGSN